MTAQEAILLTDAYNTQYKENWEKIRWLAFITATSNGATLKKPSDIMYFSWEPNFKLASDGRTEEQKKGAMDKMRKKIMGA